MRITVLIVGAAVAAAAAGPADVTEIMARVAANQQAARTARKAYVYRQEQVLRLRRGNNRVAREERLQYVVAPKTGGADKTLEKFAGRYERNGKYISYDRPGYQYKDLDIDGELIQDMAQDMMDDQKTRDGLGADLFPLTADQQKAYEFQLLGEQMYRERRVYRVGFRPRRGSEADWKGEALIDAEEYQPVSIQTSLAEKVPLLVKTLLGTDIKGLGFSVSYQRFGDGVWFPVSYGGEFEVRGLFFYRRKISVSMVNRDFRKTDVNSTVLYATDSH